MEAARHEWSAPTRLACKYLAAKYVTSFRFEKCVAGRSDRRMVFQRKFKPPPDRSY